MSGNFVQRGEPAIADKHFRSKVAIDCGADMVIELPYPYSCASAEYFAEASVTYLHKLNCVDSLCFGSECNDIPDLYTIAKLLVNEPEEYKTSLKEHLKAGLSYPKARHMALMNVLKEPKYEKILTSPNNILGIEYIKAIIKLNSNIKPVTIKRIVSDYHHKDNNNPYYSASSIRESYSNGDMDFKSLANISKLYEETHLYPVFANDFSNILGYRLLDNSRNLSEYFDISQDLANKILNNIDKYRDFKSFIDILKSKDINYSSISRGMCHIMLGTKDMDVQKFRVSSYADYIRVLSFSHNGMSLFKQIKDNSNMKIMTKLSDAENILADLPAFNKELFETSIFSDNVYRLVVQNKYNTELPNEYRHRLG